MALLRHLAGYLPVQLASALASFGGVYVFTRILSPEQYGAYALMFWTMSMIHCASLSWVESANYRFAAQAEATGETASHYRTALIFLLPSLAFGFALTGLVWVLVRNQPNYVAAMPWIFALLVVDAIIKIALEGHRAGQRVRRYAVTETFRLIAGFIFGVIAAVQFGLGAAAPLAGLAASGLLMALREGAFLLQAAEGGVIKTGAPRVWLGFGAPVAAALILDAVLGGIDRPMLAALSPQGDAAVGAYVAGYGLADKTVLLICAWAAMAASPLVLAAYEREGPAAASQQARGLIRTLLMLGVPAATGLALIARPLGEAMIGEGVRDAAIQIIPWIAFSGLLNGLLIHYFADAFTVAKKTGQRAGLMLIPAAAKIVLALVLIPRFDLMGAVYATIGAYLIGLLALGLVSRRHILFPLPIVDSVKIGLAALAMWPALHFLPHWGGWPELIIKCVIGGMVYGVVALLLDAGGARSFLKSARASRA